MGRMLTITNSGDANLGVKKTALKREIVIGPTAIKFITLAIFAILGLVYLTQSTAGANRSLKVQDINNKQSEIEQRREQLEIEKVRLESLQQIDANVEKPSMEPISRVEHLNHENYGLASR